MNCTLRGLAYASSLPFQLRGPPRSSESSLPSSLPTLLLIPLPSCTGFLVNPTSVSCAICLWKDQFFVSCIFSDGTESRTTAVFREFSLSVGFTGKHHQNSRQDTKVCACVWARACVFSFPICSPDRFILGIAGWKLCTDSWASLWVTVSPRLLPIRPTALPSPGFQPRDFFGPYLLILCFWSDQRLKLCVAAQPPENFLQLRLSSSSFLLFSFKARIPEHLSSGNVRKRHSPSKLIPSHPGVIPSHACSQRQ